MEQKLNLPYYAEDNADFDKERHLLDLFYPTTTEKNKVLVFIHGGTWISGSKSLYSSLGVNFARYGITTVVINYRLATDIRVMAGDCAKAVKWVYQNIEKYHGNKHNILLMGHSAGAHLASLISLNPDYFDAINLSNPVKGCILLDAFGLNLASYISTHGAGYMHYIAKVFSNNPEVWKNASPVNFVSNANFPFLVFTGKSTYPFIISDNEAFVNKIKSYGRNIKQEFIADKSHMEMITQMRNYENQLYEKIISFGETNY